MKVARVGLAGDAAVHASFTRTPISVAFEVRNWLLRLCETELFS